MARSSIPMRSPENVRLSSFPQSRFRELFDGLKASYQSNPHLALYPEAHIFGPILVNSQMYGAEGTSSNLILDYVLIDMMLPPAIVLVVRVFGSCIQCFFNLSMFGWRSAMMSQGALVRGGRTSFISSCLPEQATGNTYRCCMIGGLPVFVFPGRSSEIPI